jgi:hypothetical protein
LASAIAGIRSIYTGSPKIASSTSRGKTAQAAADGTDGWIKYAYPVSKVTDEWTFYI